MATGKANDSKVFSCSTCEFTVNFHYKGRKPPFANCILLHEDCYIIKDPFSTSGGFVTVGGMCSMCGKDVCMSTHCSLFYTQRFCFRCALNNLHEFPHELQLEIMQRMESKNG
ncbi:Cysteine-rich DPF motif domain-containing protein 1 [Bulinus truncatus]|nr:Cysteine-rich DPF motif domain-containing protein 1 [Bulinus truncatus]